MAIETYLDLELTISNRTQATLRSSKGSRAGTPDLSEAVLSELRATLPDAERYGIKLFKALLPYDDALSLSYREALTIARDRKQRVRLRINVDPAAPLELHDIYWELLYDPIERLALGRSREIAISRYMSVSPARQLGAISRLRALIVIANPSNLAEFNLQRLNRQALEADLTKAMEPLGSFIDYDLLPGAATRTQIGDLLLRGGYQVLHIVAHGVKGSHNKNALLLEKDDLTADIVEEDEFASLLQGFLDLRLAVLVACNSGASSSATPFSGLARQLVSGGIPAVLAMSRTISVTAASRFCAYFYFALARAGDIDAATSVARYQLFTEDPQTLDWCTPALYMQVSLGKLWSFNRTRWFEEDNKSSLGDIWSNVLLNLDQSTIVPVLGPDLNNGLLPSLAEVSREWERTYDLVTLRSLLERHNDMPRIARFIESKKGLNFPHRKLLEIYKSTLLDDSELRDRPEYRSPATSLTTIIDALPAKLDEDSPYSILARLPISTYLTVNYDSFMTAALKRATLGATLRKPVRASCSWRPAEVKEPEGYKRLKGTLENPLVFHVYGNDTQSTAMVLTEDNYLEFIRTVTRDDWRLPERLTETLTESVLLFLGFNPLDLDFRVFYKAVIGKIRQQQQDRIAVIQIQPDVSPMDELKQLKQFLRDDLTTLDIKVYWGTVKDFLLDLEKGLIESRKPVVRSGGHG